VFQAAAYTIPYVSKRNRERASAVLTTVARVVFIWIPLSSSTLLTQLSLWETEFLPECWCFSHWSYFTSHTLKPKVSPRANPTLSAKSWSFKNWMPLMWFAPNIFENCLTDTFPHVSTVLLTPFLMWALSHWHLYLNKHCPRGTSPHVTSMHTTTPLFSMLDVTDVVSPQHFENCLTGTFSYVSTVSLAPYFKSMLSQGHLPLCDMHTTTPFLVTFAVTFVI